MSTSSPGSRLFSPLVLLTLGLALVLCGVYATGLHNALIFDDARLTDGTVVQGYGGAAAFNWRRWLSYSSFIWLGLDGEVFTAQRVFNLLLHLGVCASVFALFAQLVQLLPLNGQDEEEARARRRAAVLVGVVVFALNPVAVYAVGYLIQRSIVMATGFAVLSCACLVRGLLMRGAVAWAWYAGALLAGALAVLSKEHALMLPLMAVVLYVYVRRPSAKHMAVMSSLGVVALAVCAALMWKALGNIVGAATMDDTSEAYLAQLNALHPGFAQQAYALSLINQAALFFVYGALWLLPNPGWMAMDLRLLQHGVGAGANLQELLGIGLARQGPQARTGAATQDDGLNRVAHALRACCRHRPARVSPVVAAAGLAGPVSDSCGAGCGACGCSPNRCADL